MILTTLDIVIVGCPPCRNYNILIFERISRLHGTITTPFDSPELPDKVLLVHGRNDAMMHNIPVIDRPAKR